MRALKFAAVAVLALNAVSPEALAATYKIDPDHSSVSFKVKHLFSWVPGKFSKFDGTVAYEPGKPETWGAEGTIETASIDTGVAKRDEHLRGKDFFEVETFPQILFKTVKAEALSETQARVEGILTLHGVEKPVVLDVEILGIDKDPWGNVAAGFTATTKLNRKDFGINWNQTLDSGGLLVGEEVQITLDIAAIQQ